MRRLTPEDLLRYAIPTDPQPSPDGSRILFALKAVGEKLKVRTQLHLVSPDQPESPPHPLTTGEASASQGRWLPDGRGIVFVRKVGAGPQIHRLDLNVGGEARVLTQLREGSLDGLKPDPTGRRIAFLFRPSHADFTEAAAERRKETGESIPPRITEKARYRLDGDGYFMEQRFSVWVHCLESGETREIFSGCPVDAYSLDWHPTGDVLYVSRSVVRNPWRDPEDERIFRVGLDGTFEEVVEQREAARGRKMALRVSPDGRHLAWLGNPNGDDHRDMDNTGLFVMPIEGGEVRRLVESLDLNFDTPTLSDTSESPPAFLEWTSDSNGLVVHVAGFGVSHVGVVHLDTETYEPWTQGNRVVFPGGFRAGSGVLGTIESAANQPPEVGFWSANESKGQVLTRMNPWLSEVHLQDVREEWVETTDGLRVHTWVMLPPETNPDAKLPTVLEIHGGPQCQYGFSYFHEFQVLAAAGYAVVYSNPRGSKGYGRAWGAAIEGHWGGKDWEDIHAVTQWMAAQPFVDSARMGVMGGSYGGYMVNWVVGHSQAFRAAITDRCVSNLLSKSGNSDYPYFPGTYWKGSFYQDLEGIADLWRDSPIAYFDRVNTPMLIIHSEGDLRCNIEQSEQVFTALQERDIPCRFVRYPLHTSHGMSRNGPPDLRIHRLREILEWWSRWL